MVDHTDVQAPLVEDPDKPPMGCVISAIGCGLVTAIIFLGFLFKFIKWAFIY